MDLPNGYIITLQGYRDRKKYAKLHCKKKELKKYKFFEATKHENPKRGCLESHMNVLKQAIEKGYKQVLIMEDDVQFLKKMDKKLPIPPSNWDMLYLGGTVHRIIEKSPPWTRMTCWTTHAYIVNLENSALVGELFKAYDYDQEIDRYYLEKIHPQFNCYMIDPMIAIQKPGFSTIENREVNYDFMKKTLDGLKKPNYTIENDNYVLKLDPISAENLPKVSIITPTYNRTKLFPLAINNFNNFDYPKNKLEWIIIDDSTDEETIENILPVDKRIRYLRIADENIKRPLTIAHKRNIGVQKSTGTIIVHMDDDDYYPPHSVISRVKVLKQYEKQGIHCVGCSLIGNYNIMNDTSSISCDSPISLSEASMGYTRQFWNHRPFNSADVRGEHKFFMEGRLENVMDLPHSFVITALNHNQNFTQNMRKAKKNNELNYFDTWDEETQMFMLDLKRFLQKSS
jgi:GR25 family glycosyltransferase involved in LPS biosynthesis